MKRPRIATLLALVPLGILAITLTLSGRANDAESHVRTVTPRGPLLPEEQRLTELFRRTSASVVHITSQRLFRRRFTRDVYSVPEGSGSGFIWDRDGRIVTNFHVIQNGEAFQVVLSDGSSWPAKLIGAAPHQDIAVLQIEAPADALTPIDLGTSADLLVGQSVYAIGNPFGLDQSLTSGIISAVEREITSRMRTTIYDVIQSDTAVNPGNSGGPLLDSAGRLIGVNTAIFSPTGTSAGISFAIPVDAVRRTVPDLIAFGRVQKPIIGFVSAPWRIRGLPGVLVGAVESGSVPERAGLRGTVEDRDGNIVYGDIIVAVDDLATPTLADLNAVLERYRPGDTVRLTLVRGIDSRGEGGRRVTIETRLQADE